MDAFSTSKLHSMADYESEKLNIYKISIGMTDDRQTIGYEFEEEGNVVDKDYLEGPQAKIVDEILSKVHTTNILEFQGMRINGETVEVLKKYKNIFSYYSPRFNLESCEFIGTAEEFLALASMFKKQVYIYDMKISDAIMCDEVVGSIFKTVKDCVLDAGTMPLPNITDKTLEYILDSIRSEIVLEDAITPSYTRILTYKARTNITVEGFKSFVKNFFTKRVYTATVFLGQIDMSLAKLELFCDELKDMYSTVRIDHYPEMSSRVDILFNGMKVVVEPNDAKEEKYIKIS